MKDNTEVTLLFCCHILKNSYVVLQNMTTM